MQKLIYIADDEQNIRQMMKAFLESEGYAVEDIFQRRRDTPGCPAENS